MVPFYGWGSTASGSQSYYDEAVYFLPPCSRNSSEWWKAGLMNLEPRSGFEHRNPTTIIEWYASAQFSCQNENFVNTSKVGTLEKYRSCHQRCSMKKAATLLKRRLAQVLSGEFCKISNNTFFTEHLWMAVFKNRNYHGINSWVQSRSNLGFI